MKQTFHTCIVVPGSGRGHGEAASPVAHCTVAPPRDGGDEGLELLLLLVVHLGAVVELALALAQRPLPLLQLDLHGVQLEVEVVHLGKKMMIYLDKEVFHSLINYRVVQLNFTPEVELFHMLFERSLSISV